MRETDLIKISEMASLHGISRQTLILYDKNGLLKPVKVAENGYRYYSVNQIPRLRQICLLKEIGVPLHKIRGYLEDPTPEDLRDLLAQRRASIALERDRLNRQLEDLELFGQVFENMSMKELNLDLPHVIHREERQAIFSPYPSADMNRINLHLALMDAWNALLEAGTIPSRGFGSLLDVEAVMSDQPLRGAGCIVILPRPMHVEGRETIVLPEGDYVCMYKRSMPYDTEPARRLLSWMDGRGLTPQGTIIDRCILDSVFHESSDEGDFCRLEILIEQAL